LRAASIAGTNCLPEFRIDVLGGVDAEAVDAIIVDPAPKISIIPGRRADSR
jgi:hypothetical protein